MKIKAAIFDMDGTLVDSLSYWESFWRRFGKKYFDTDDFVYDAEIDRRVRTMIFKDVLVLLHDFYKLDCTVEELHAFSSDSLEDFYETEATVKAGSFAFLEHLRAKGIKICLASATEMKYIKHALACQGLEKYFDCILSCADIGKGKDTPDIYLQALETLGVSAEEACIFEDSYVALETAKKIGCQTVGIFDPNNYCQERLRAASDIYIAEGHAIDELIPCVEREN